MVLRRSLRKMPQSPVRESLSVDVSDQQLIPLGVTIPTPSNVDTFEAPELDDATAYKRNCFENEVPVDAGVLICLKTKWHILQPTKSFTEVSLGISEQQLQTVYLINNYCLLCD